MPFVFREDVSAAVLAKHTFEIFGGVIPRQVVVTADANLLHLCGDPGREGRSAQATA